VKRIKLILGASILLLVSVQVGAAIIEFDLDYTLGPIVGEFGEGQSLRDNASFFPDEAFTVDVGDTLIFDILFDQRLHVFDFREPTEEVFTFGLNTFPGAPGFNGTWVSSIEALGARGDIWSDPITQGFGGGGAGFGWGGVGLEVTSSAGFFTGVRWTTTITSANEGAPLTLYAFTGFSASADGFFTSPLPVPAPPAIWLFGIGMIGLGFARRKQRPGIPENN
jgi:hypothetical protein